MAAGVPLASVTRGRAGKQSNVGYKTTSKIKILGEAKQGQAGGWLQHENTAELGQDSLIHLPVTHRVKARCKPVGKQVARVPPILKGLVYIGALGI